MDTSSKTVVVGLSGGVDSSVTAHLLCRQEYNVVGLFMKNWEEDDTESFCAAEQDRLDAEKVCTKLDIELHTVNFSYEYWERVFEEFLDEYKAGRTPNPDILCNREIKFKEFLKYAEKLGAEFIATGHYAQHKQADNQHFLLRGADKNKDQSYFLYAINPDALAKTLFPIGEMTKPKVREIAGQLGFENHNKKDSTGICFIGERKFKEFLSNYLKPHHGDILSVEGKKIGQHDGLIYYTLGQRQGMGIGGEGEAWYVASKDIENNILYAAQGHDHPALFSQQVFVTDIHLLNQADTANKLPCTAKTRYRQTDQPCKVEFYSNQTAEVYFDQPQRAVTPGQSMVFYDGEICLGGGIIHSTDQKNQ